MRRLLPLLVIVGLALAAPASQARCLRYEPQKVTLTGKVVARRLPGPPSYRNVARGDYPETVHFLVLDEPFCVTGDRASRTNKKTHMEVFEVQLASEDLPLRRFESKRVRATGKLFGAHMPYHRTPVVLRVGQVRAVP